MVDVHDCVWRTHKSFCEWCTDAIQLQTITASLHYQNNGVCVRGITCCIARTSALALGPRNEFIDSTFAVLRLAFCVCFLFVCIAGYVWALRVSSLTNISFLAHFFVCSQIVEASSGRKWVGVWNHNIVCSVF